jgi:HTH-type transcriptional regulator, glycine betaine synthesis regulator
MTDTYQQTTDSLVQALGQLAESAGFNRMIGQIYGLLYLSPARLSLGEIAEKLNASKGSASLNTTSMERWGMIKRINLPADRRDYYEADTDFWKVIRGILRNREKKLINDLKVSIANSMKELKNTGAAGKASSKDDVAKFYQARLKHLMDFLNTFTRMFNAYMALERFNFGGLGATGKGKGEVENED